MKVSTLPVSYLLPTQSHPCCPVLQVTQLKEYAKKKGYHHLNLEPRQVPPMAAYMM
jgi:hypothetical protein